MRLSDLFSRVVSRPAATCEVLPPQAATLARVDLEQRVDAGAAWLDVKYPGWFLKVKTKSLDLEDGCQCVFGQLFRNFNAIEDYLRVMEPDVDLVARGLNLPEHDRTDANWQALTNCWRRAINTRRAWAKQAKYSEVAVNVGV